MSLTVFEQFVISEFPPAPKSINGYVDSPLPANPGGHLGETAGVVLPKQTLTFKNADDPTETPGKLLEVRRGKFSEGKGYALSESDPSVDVVLGLVGSSAPITVTLHGITGVPEGATITEIYGSGATSKVENGSATFDLGTVKKGSTTYRLKASGAWAFTEISAQSNDGSIAAYYQWKAVDQRTTGPGKTSHTVNVTVGVTQSESESKTFEKKIGAEVGGGFAGISAKLTASFSASSTKTYAIAVSKATTVGFEWELDFTAPQTTYQIWQLFITFVADGATLTQALPLAQFGEEEYFPPQEGGKMKLRGSKPVNEPTEKQETLAASPSYHTIDDHKGSTEMGCFIVCVDVKAHVYLQENHDDNSLSLKVDYKYSGAKDGKGTTRLPISGNAEGCKDVRDDVEICYSITNFSKEEGNVTLDLTASVAHTSYPEMGPDYVFKKQRFSGALSSTQISLSQSRLASYTAIHEKVRKLTGASVKSLYPRHD